jgi:hypothetical protein
MELADITCKVEASDSSQFLAPKESPQACSILIDTSVPNALQRNYNVHNHHIKITLPHKIYR